MAYTNRRNYPRFEIDILLEDINIKNISRKGLLIKDLKEKDISEINLLGKALKIKKIWERESLTGFEIEQELSNEFLKTLFKDKLKKLKENKEIKKSKRKEDFIEFLTKIAPLLKDLNDPFTNIDKLEKDVSPIEELSLYVINYANSAFSSASSLLDIKDLKSAIRRIGLDNTAKIVHIFIAQKLSQNKKDSFKNFNAFILSKTFFIKEISKLYGCKNYENTISLIISLDILGIFAIEEEIDIKEDIFKIYTKSYILKNRESANISFIEAFYENFRSFDELFDIFLKGYILGFYDLIFSLKLLEAKLYNVSKESIRSSFLFFLTFLFVNYVFGKDIKSGFILLNKLSKLGLDSQKALDLINRVINETNKELSKLNLKEEKIRESSPIKRVEIDENITKTTFFNLFLSVKENKTLFILYEEEDIFDIVFDIINLEESFRKESYTVIDFSTVESFGINSLESFEIVIFKSIEKIDILLLKEILKVYNGKKIFCSEKLLFLEEEREDIFELLKAYYLDFNSIFKK